MVSVIILWSFVGSLSIVTAALGVALYRRRKNLQEMSRILEDIAQGNPDRRLIAKDNTALRQVYYQINQIVKNDKQEIMSLRQSERIYKQLVTNLSHDIRTPLASLMGYLSAMEDGIVEGEEKETYLKLSVEKADILKEYIDTLFEWLKLESGERIFEFAEKDICELSREIMIDWIAQLEQRQIDYEIRIPERQLMLLLDEGAYKRCLNNLLQNIIDHSRANRLILEIEELLGSVRVSLADNGIGIAEADLQHIFKRLYRCDTARSGKGNGLGLAIVTELVKANKGTVRAESKQGEGTRFIMEFAKA